MYKTGSHSSLLAYKKCSAIRRSHNTSLSTDRPDSSSDDRISYCPYIHNNRFYSIRSKHKGKYLLILLQDALERIFTEFKGLKAQYLFIFCGGLLALFVLFIILYMVGIDQWICIGFGVASSSVLVWQTFALNARYGEHGLMKLGATRSHPRYLINRRRITRLFKRKRKEETT